MTRAEYLEFVQESLSFPLEITEERRILQGTVDMNLRDTPEVCAALQRAHEYYCTQVEMILFPERFRKVDLSHEGDLQPV